MWAEHWGWTSRSPEEQGEAAGTREWGQDTAAPADNLEPFPLSLAPCPEEMCYVLRLVAFKGISVLTGTI